MAASAHAGRTTASRPRRRPAARRVPRRGAAPAASTGTASAASRSRWSLLAVLYSYLNPVIDFVKTYTATTAAKAELHEVLDENNRLHWRVQNGDDPIVLDAKARQQGMVRPGETPYVIRGSGN